MTAYRPQQVEAFVKRPDPHVRAVLFFGEDRGLSSERARKVVETVAGTLDDPFVLARLDDTTLAADPTRLLDEARAVPLTGGRRVVWVTGAGTGFAEAVDLYLAADTGDSLVVAEAGPLLPKARLRVIFEASKVAVAAPSYLDHAASLDALIDAAVADAGMTITPAARSRLIELLGADRGLSRSELAKLVTYCFGQQAIDVDDVTAVCGDVSALALDALIDATFAGDMEQSDLLYGRLVTSGISPAGILTAVGNHIVRLQALQNAIAGGQALRDAMRTARPPLHFTREASLRNQLRCWTQQRLSDLMAHTWDTAGQARLTGQPEATMVGRHLLLIAWTAARGTTSGGSARSTRSYTVRPDA